MLLDFIYIVYYISRNLIFSIFFRNEIFLQLLNSLIRPNDELISKKIKKQTELFLKIWNWSNSIGYYISEVGS